MKLDKEYQTMYFEEVKFLREQGVEPSFEKQIDGIKIFKYTKSPQLFNQLGIFYAQK